MPHNLLVYRAASTKSAEKGIDVKGKLKEVPLNVRQIKTKGDGETKKSGAELRIEFGQEIHRTSKINLSRDKNCSLTWCFNLSRDIICSSMTSKSSLYYTLNIAGPDNFQYIHSEGIL